MTEMKLVTNLMVALVVAAALVYTAPIQPEGVPAFDDIVTEQKFETYSDSVYYYEVTRYPANAEVSETLDEEKLSIGVATDRDNLKFGTIPQGDNTGKRFIDLSNKNSEDVIVVVNAMGDIAPFVKFSKSDFVLAPGETTTVDAVFSAKDAAVGTYDGEIDVIVKKLKSGAW